MKETTDNNRRLRRTLAALFLAAVFCASSAGSVHAAGTPAGNVITNSATVDFTMSGTAFTAASSATSVVVAELLELSVVWQDAGPVAVRTGQADQAVTYRLTNVGNGMDQYLLSAMSTTAGAAFDPVLTAIYLDSNGNSVCEPGTDALYTAGVNDPVLAPDAFQVIFVVNSMPAGLANGDTGITVLTAESRTGAGVPGTVVPGQGEAGTDAVVGASGGRRSAPASYVVSDTMVNLVKSAAVTGPSGGGLLVTGATIRYAIAATVSGGGIAAGVVVSDPYPANTTYVPGSLRLNGAVLTDGADADAGDAGVTSAGAVTVRLGDLDSGSAVQTITFEVIVN